MRWHGGAGGMLTVPGSGVGDIDTSVPALVLDCLRRLVGDPADRGARSELP